MASKITVCLGSCRPGGLDITFSALARQTYDNFEVLFVDGRYRKRHAQTMAAAERFGLRDKCDSMGPGRFMHVPNHRNAPEGSLWTTPAAGFNTALMLAAGEIVLFMMDYSLPRPDWVASHVRAHEEGPASGRLVFGPYRYFDPPAVWFTCGKPEDPLIFKPGAPQTTGANIVAQRERFHEIDTFSDPVIIDATSGVKEHHRTFETGPLDVTWCHTKNESFPRELALRINGFPEWYDRVCGPGDIDFGFQLGEQGVQGWLEKGATLDAIDMRWVLTNGSIVVPRSRFADDPMARDRPYYDLGDRFYQNRRGIAGRINNHYDLRKKSLEIWDWRTWGASGETLVPDTAMADEDYFPEWHTSVVKSIARGDRVAV